MKNKPTEEGYYVWRQYNRETPHLVLCRVYLDGHNLYVDFQNGESSLLEDCADREWFKVEGL